MSRIQLKCVRLSFPALFSRASFEGKEGKFEATFLIHKDDQESVIEVIENAQQDFLLETFGSEDKIPKSLKNTCYKDGDNSDYDGYQNHMSLKATSNRRPTVIGRDKAPVAEDDDIIYAGCYVNAIVDFWYSNHAKGGKQLLANVLGVQFVKEGESFSSAQVADADDFDAIDDDNEDDF